MRSRASSIEARHRLDSVESLKGRVECHSVIVLIRNSFRAARFTTDVSRTNLPKTVLLAEVDFTAARNGRSPSQDGMVPDSGVLSWSTDSLQHF